MPTCFTELGRSVHFSVNS